MQLKNGLNSHDTIGGYGRFLTVSKKTADGSFNGSGLETIVHHKELNCTDKISEISLATERELV